MGQPSNGQIADMYLQLLRPPNTAPPPAAITMFSTRENVSMKAIGFGDGPNLPYIQSLLEIMGDRGELLTAIDGVQLVSSFVQAAAELSHTGRRKVR